MRLNNDGKLRKHHQFIGGFSIKKGVFNHKSTNQPKPPEENKKFNNYKYFVIISTGDNYAYKSSSSFNRKR